MPRVEEHLSLPLTVDSFTLAARIGAGAMGEVYRATEALTGRAIAIKVMSAHLINNRRAETRFRREIAAMGQLRHAGIPAFAGYGELPGGRPYLAMEFVDGHPLDAFVPEGRPLPEDLALWVVLQLAEVIGYCNRESGMIHRDLKPSNVMVDLVGQPGLCEQSRLRVIDFGLASYIDFGDFEDFSVGPRDRAMAGTIVGEVMGTPAYMSPEQIRGEALTFHSDIYALGAILCHLLTGRMPYTGSSAGVVMAAHLDAPVPDPSRLAPVRMATVAVVQRAMAKAASARFRSFNQFCASLQAARYATGQATKRITRDFSAHPGQPDGKQPSTVGTESTDALQPPTTGWSRRPDQPAQPSPPGSSGTSSWRRPAVEGAAGTSAWRRPGGQNPALQPAAEPPTDTPSYMFKAVSVPPVQASPTDEFPATPSAPPVQQPAGAPATSSQWRRPPLPPPASP